MADEVLGSLSDPTMMGALSGTDMGIGSLYAAMSGIFIAVILVILAVYIYLALAYTQIGKKAKLQTPAVAWFSPVVTVFEIAKMGWWPLPVMTIGYLLILMLSLVAPVLFAVLMVFWLIFLIVILTMWQWKTYEAVNNPGWFAIVPVGGVVLGVILMIMSPIAGVIVMILGMLSYLVFSGIAAWG